MKVFCAKGKSSEILTVLLLVVFSFRVKKLGMTATLLSDALCSQWCALSFCSELSYFMMLYGIRFLVDGI